MATYQELLITRGLPASGKTTWARTFVTENPTYKRVNKDDLRQMFNRGVFSREHEYAVVRARDALIVALLGAGFSVVVDDTNIKPYHITQLVTLASVLGIKVRLVPFNTSATECIERDESRYEDHVGRAVIERMALELEAVIADGDQACQGLEVLLP